MQLDIRSRAFFSTEYWIYWNQKSKEWAGIQAGEKERRIRDVSSGKHEEQIDGVS